MENFTKVRAINVSPPKDKLSELLGINDGTELNQVQLPDSRHFYAIPEKKPHLRPCIVYFDWDLASHQITIVANETPNLGFYNWITSLSSETPEDNDESITLILQDKQENECGRVLFKRLQLEKHKCDLQCTDEEEPLRKEAVPVQHYVVLRFESTHIENAHEKCAQADFENDPDKEWIEDELKIKFEESELSDEKNLAFCEM